VKAAKNSRCCAAAKSSATPKNTAATPMLASGPAMAMLNSSPGVAGSSSIWATPPKMNRVILLMGMPERRATSAWDSSCATTDPKNSSVVAMAVSQYHPLSRFGAASGKYPRASRKTNNPKMMNQL